MPLTNTVSSSSSSSDLREISDAPLHVGYLVPHAILLQHLSVRVTSAFVLAAILKCWLYANLDRLLPPFAEYGRGSSGIGRGKSIGLTEGILLPAEAVDSNRSRPETISVFIDKLHNSMILYYISDAVAIWQDIMIIN